MKDKNKQITSISWVVFIAICILVLILGYLVEEKFRSIETSRAHNTLISIGSLKANDLSSWLKDIQNHNKLLMQNEAFIEKIYQYTVFNKVSELHTIHNYLKHMQELHGYLTVEYISADEAISISPSTTYPISELNKKDISNAIAKNKIIFTDLHKHQTNGDAIVGTDVYIPIRYYNNGEHLILGVILIRTDANNKIFPLLEVWPFKSESAETLLVKREKDQVLFLTDFRFTRDEAFELTHSIDNKSLPAAIALRGYEGVMTGLDYRGVEVIAISHKIAGTNMALISKIDSKEVYHYVELITRWAINITLIILSTVFISFYYWHRLFNERLIAQRYKSQLDKKALESHLELLSKYANDIILLTDSDWKIIEVNERALAAYQCNYEEIIGQIYTDLKADQVWSENKEVFDGSFNDGFIFEDKHKRKDNSTFPVEVSLRTIKKEGTLYRQLIIRDITERKNIEHRFKLAVNATEQGIWDWDLDLNILWWSDNTYKLLGYVNDAFIPSYDLFLEKVHPEDRQLLEKYIDLTLTEKIKIPLDIEVRIQLKSGKYCFFILRGQSEFNEKNQPVRLLGSILNITELKKYQSKLKKEEIKYATLIENIPECVYSFRVNKKSLETKQIFISSEWKEWTGKDVDEMMEDPHLWHKVIHDDDKKERFKRFAAAIKNNTDYNAEYRLVNVKTNEAHYVKDHALRRAEEGGGENVIYDGIMSDITSEKVAQLESENSNELYKNSLIETIKAISVTVEKRDPYTAGHQNRVAELSGLIAGKLNLTQKQIKGLRLGAMIHDIGKIYIPAEILNRPGKLTAAEFDMIKSHPVVGYDIIKNISFPWPVAKMILQHHERLDGSGYPKGLKKDEIILEAQILTVADVVEAITAHRPYRASLSLDVAIDEIKKHRGIYYSPDIVDACLEIIESTEFNLDQLGDASQSS
jgi:PAS domain S-box-containing protein/putative nucleotidyltransferase with HDIG domain